MKKETTAKILSTFIGCASLFSLMTVLTGCPQPTTPVVEEEKNEVLLIEGIADWNEFKEKTFEYVTADDGSVSVNVLTIDNIDEIKGFMGYANYNDVKSFLDSDLYNGKKFDTTNLDIYFDYVAKDGEGIEITPTILEDILDNFSNVNISNLDELGNKNPVKFSSGAVDASGEVDVFDIAKYLDLLSSNKLNITDGAEITQSTTSVNVIGVKDPFLSQNASFSSDIILSVMNHPLFINSKIDDITITGNLKNILPLIEKEYVEDTIDFKDSFYKSNQDEIDSIEFGDFQDLVIRGNKNFDGVKVTDDNVAVDTNLDLSDSNLDDFEFSNGIDLSSVSLNNVTSKNSLIFKSILPKSIENITADKIIFDGATVYNDGATPATKTIFTTKGGIKNLEIKTLNNPDLFSGDGKGSVEFFKGSESIYDMLKYEFNIKTKDTNLITKVINNLNQKYYS